MADYVETREIPDHYLFKIYDDSDICRHAVILPLDPGSYLLTIMSSYPDNAWATGYKITNPREVDPDTAFDKCSDAGLYMSVSDGDVTIAVSDEEKLAYIIDDKNKIAYEFDVEETDC